MVTIEQFDRARRLALRLAGIELLPRHRELLDRRSGELGTGDEGGLDALLGQVEAGDGPARRRLLGLLTTKFTGFFRHPRHFDLAAEQALWAVHRRGTARLWSAATATGEEAYSLAMALIEVFGRDDPPATILATDVDADALETARRGEYGEACLGGLPPDRRARFGAPSPGSSGRWALAPAVRRLVEFRAFNLIDRDWRVEAPFDVVLCRNVLMYLETRHRDEVIERIADRMTPGGLLILDPAEQPRRAMELFQTCERGVFMRGGRKP
jgi:chemotaxis protein methyltransferase CheR